MKPTIEDLLNALVLKNTSKKTLENSKSTWSRIGQKDDFSELGLTSSELGSFLKEWTESNPYM